MRTSKSRRKRVLQKIIHGIEDAPQHMRDRDDRAKQTDSRRNLIVKKRGYSHGGKRKKRLPLCQTEDGNEEFNDSVIPSKKLIKKAVAKGKAISLRPTENTGRN